MILETTVKSQFTVFSLMPNVDLNTEIKAELIQAGFESYTFLNQVALLEKLRETVPHVLVFSVEGLTTTLSDFVSQVLKWGPDVQFVCVAPASQGGALLEYRDFGFAELVPDGDSTGSRVLWAVERTCEGLYLTYQNEQLVDQKEQRDLRIQILEDELERKERNLQRIQGLDVGSLLSLYREAHSKEQLVQALFSSVTRKAQSVSRDIFGVYLVYLPSIQSFVATLGLGVDLSKARNLNCALTQQEAQEFHILTSAPQAVTSFVGSLTKSSAVFHWVSAGQDREALVAFWSSSDITDIQIENEFLLFEQIYQRFHFQKKAESLDYVDSVTELPNRDFFLKRLEEEVSRSRRLQEPLSVLKISLDHYAELEQSLGKTNKNVVLKTVATMIGKTSRVNDFTCRTQENEISLILPHCPVRGAALRAERLRRMVESQLVTQSGLRITISCGISEFPALCSSVDDLEKSSREALEHIKSKGGNKVCLYKPAEGFKPEFAI